ncbi:MAG: hypothetical protein FWD69_04745 [Polyangiaceae bacterium]|nr:hypothetical protein [Polyangiaceae bacterium]
MAASWQSPLARAAALGFAHLLVDAACVTAIFRTGGSAAAHVLGSFAVVFGYDLLAFAAQAPLGMLVDRFGFARASAAFGLMLSALALFFAPHSSLVTMLAAGIGNALFHLGAGASVLRFSGAHATPAGLFVAPGALGLGIGSWMGKTGIGPTWPLIALVLLALPLVDFVATSTPDNDETEASRLSPGLVWFALSLIFLSVMIRSYVGFGAPHECEKGTLALLIGIPLAAFAGKSTGGLFADRLGWTVTGVGALILSAPLIAFNGGSTPLTLAGLVLFQMTMPVTLVAASQLLPGRPATAFGIPSLALILGAIPTFFPWGRDYSAEVFLVLIAVSAASLLGALSLLGKRREGAVLTLSSPAKT